MTDGARSLVANTRGPRSRGPHQRQDAFPCRPTRMPTRDVSHRRGAAGVSEYLVSGMLHGWQRSAEASSALLLLADASASTRRRALIWPPRPRRQLVHHPGDEVPGVGGPGKQTERSAVRFSRGDRQDAPARPCPPRPLPRPGGSIIPPWSQAACIDTLAPRCYPYAPHGFPAGSCSNWPFASPPQLSQWEREDRSAT